MSEVGARYRDPVTNVLGATRAGSDAYHSPEDAYQVGDRVTFEGQTYESTINGNVWSPSAYPQGWKVV